MIKTLTSTFNALRTASANAALGLTNGKDVVENIKIIRESGIFDLEFYNTQLEESCSGLSTAIAHYLNTGAAQNLDLHPLFDTAFYKSTNKDIDFSINNPLVHFITKGGREGRDPNPLFDVQFYINEYVDVRRATINPLAHYLNFGAKERRTPSPIFDPKKYRSKAQDADLQDALYYHVSANKKLNVVRGVGKVKIQKDGKANKISEWNKLRLILTRRENLLTYFLSEGLKKKVLPFPSFELLYEVQAREQFKSVKENKKYWRVIPRDLSDYESVQPQFISFARQAAKANLSKEKYQLYKELVQSFTIKRNAYDFMHSDKTIILASHQANLSGAPLLLLHIAKNLTAKGWECLLFLERTGEIEKDFNDCAHIINFHEALGREKKCGQYMSLLFDDMHFARPKICLLNSLETGGYAQAMQENGIEIISLVHELVDTYPHEFLKDVFERSDRLIFPAEYVREFAEKTIPGVLQRSKEAIIPNALLEPEFGDYDRELARSALLREIQAPENSLIVLGCGSPEMRKGMDLFVVAARIILSKWHEDPAKFSNRPIHFVWVGADKIERFSPHYYVDWDVKQGDLQSNIHLLSSRKDLRPVFHGADLFALPSRKDPFPCVVHNAMAANLPVVAFNSAGGVPEMLAGGGAKIVCYGDILAFTNAIENYLVKDNERVKDGKLNAEIVATKFDFKKYMLQIENQISSVLGDSVSI